MEIVNLIILFILFTKNKTISSRYMVEKKTSPMHEKSNLHIKNSGFESISVQF